MYVQIGIARYLSMEVAYSASRPIHVRMSEECLSLRGGVIEQVGASRLVALVQ
jgi:hypothetical protein